MILIQVTSNLVQELNKDNIPNISQMDEAYLNLDIDEGNKYSVPYMFGTVGLIYNKDVVTEPVDSWDILWNEKYKGKIFMFDTYRDTMGAALKKLNYSLNTTNAKEIEEAKQLLLDQRKLVSPLYGVDNGTTMIPAGESDINMIWSGEGLNLQDEYPNLVYVVPKEGANFWIDSLCIPYNASNVDGAEKFINFVSDKESALRIADEIGYTTPNREARLEQPEEVRTNPNAYMPKEIMDRCEIYTDFPSDVKKIYDDAWTEYGVDDGTTMIPAGESDINMIWSGEGLNLQDEYPNLVYVVPKEGANFWIDSLCIPYNASNVEGAEKFINFVSDKESALRIADEIGYTTPNREARLEQPEEVRNNPNAYMPKEIMDRCEIYTDFPSDVKKIYDDAWTEIKSAN